MCYDGPQGINSFSLLGLCNYVISICFLISFCSGREGTQRNEVSLRGLLPILFISSLILLPLSHITNVYSLQTYVLWPTRLFCLWDSPGKNTGMCCHALLPFLASSFQLPIHVRHFVTPWTAVGQASMSITNSCSLFKLMSIKSVMPSNHLILYHPLLLSPSIFPSIRVFSNESVLRISWPNYWSFSFNISPSKNIQDWFPLGWTGWISLQSKGLSRVFSNTTVQKHQFFSAQPSSQSNSHIHTLPLRHAHIEPYFSSFRGLSQYQNHIYSGETAHLVGWMTFLSEASLLCCSCNNLACQCQQF